MAANRLRIEPLPVSLEQINGLAERFRRRTIEEDPCRTFPGKGTDRFEDAAVSIGDDRLSASLGLDRSNSEILCSGKDQGSAPLIVLPNLLIGLPSEELNLLSSFLL